MSTARRVRRETGWRSLACAVCGPDTTHALIRSGNRRWLLFGPPSGDVHEYARCLSCGTRRSQDDTPTVVWTDTLHPAAEPISVDPR